MVKVINFFNLFPIIPAHDPSGMVFSNLHTSQASAPEVQPKQSSVNTFTIYEKGRSINFWTVILNHICPVQNFFTLIWGKDNKDLALREEEASASVIQNSLWRKYLQFGIHHWVSKGSFWGMSYWTLKTLWLQKISVQGSNFTNLTWNGFLRLGR